VPFARRGTDAVVHLLSARRCRGSPTAAGPVLEERRPSLVGHIYRPATISPWTWLCGQKSIVSNVCGTSGDVTAASLSWQSRYRAASRHYRQVLCRRSRHCWHNIWLGPSGNRLTSPGRIRHRITRWIAQRRHAPSIRRRRDRRRFFGCQPSTSGARKIVFTLGDWPPTGTDQPPLSLSAFTSCAAHDPACCQSWVDNWVSEVGRFWSQLFVFQLSLSMWVALIHIALMDDFDLWPRDKITQLRNNSPCNLLHQNTEWH